MGMTLQIDHACWLGEDAWFHRGTILIKEGRIAALRSRLAIDEPSVGSSPPSPLHWNAAARRLDAKGLFIVPGLIDSHVHLREPGQAYKEGIANGTAAALKGGVTTVLDMPNNRPPCTTRARLEEKRGRFARKSRVNYGLYLQAVADGGGRVPARVAGVKIYMAKSSPLEAIRDTDSLERIFRGHRRVVIHAEDEQTFSTPWKKSFHTMENAPHHVRRPRAALHAALKSIEQAYLCLPVRQRPRLVIAHCSTAEEIAWVAKMKGAGHDVWAETCPHYFLLTQEDYTREGSRLQVNPPLRSEADRAAVFKAVRDGRIDFVSTDHAPHTPAEKASRKAPPSGFAGIEWLGPILLSLAVRGEISWKRYLELAGHNAARCFGIKARGRIRKGQWADLVFVAPGPVPKQKPGDIVTRAAFAPYAQFDFTARVRAVLINGELALEGGRLHRAVRGREVYT